MHLRSWKRVSVDMADVFLPSSCWSVTLLTFVPARQPHFAQTIQARSTCHTTYKHDAHAHLCHCSCLHLTILHRQ